MNTTYLFQEKELRDREIEDFWICVNEAKYENTRQAAILVDEFKAYKSKVLVSYFLNFFLHKIFI